MIAFSKMGGAFRRADNGWFDESGDLALDLRIVGIFDKFNSNTFYTRTPFANGSYRSIYGMIQRNEADITFTDIPLPGDDIGFTGPVMSENYIAIRSVPSFNTKAIDLAECLFDIDTRVVLLLIMTLMAVSAILRQSWKRNGTKMAAALWKVSCWLRQADGGPIEGHSGQIAAIFMFVSMSFFYMIWSNLFVTDMISVDDSDVVTSLDDVMRLNKSSMLDGEDPMIQHFLLSSQKHASIFREKIYPTAKTKLALDDPDGYSNKYARFGGYQIMRFVSDMYCIMRQTTGYHAQYYYFAPRRYGSVLQAPLMSKQISGENRLKLEKYWYQLSESGIRNFIFRDMGKAFEKMSAYKTPIAGCYILSIAEKFYANTRKLLCKKRKDFKMPKHGPKVMVWGGISTRGPTTLAEINGTVNSEVYQTILNEHYLMISRTLYPDGCIFIQDGATCHTSKSSMAWLRDHGVQVIWWPPNSPDLNIIENVWAYMKRKLTDQIYTNVADWKCRIRELWEEESVAHIDALIADMPRRLELCLANHGGRIDR
ncbi:Transposable element Tcb2 transposase [Halotydeus destructor]|nr:Transposable element Tcb2 transposase [Halotydeus destructor]